jgi:nicastrin
MACLNPLRHDLDFMNLGDIAGMIAIDQIGVLSTENTFYVQSSGNGFSEYLSDVFVDLTTDDWSIEESSSGAVPPTPLSSLIQLSEGGIGGVVLTGYDDSFADDAHYLSHLDSNSIRPINLQAIATAATAVARAAVAAAYDDDGDDSANAVAYAQNLIPDMDSNDESLLELSDCLLTNGSCDLLLKYGKVERINQRDDTGYDLGMGVPLGKPPNYYVSVFDASNGQAFVQVDGIRYGAYTGETDYGKSEDDAFFVRPSLLEMSIHGLLNDYLGRGSTDSDGGDGVTLKSCESSSDCSSISYCSSSGDSGVCTGGKQCVCSRSHYHVALDEAIVPVPNNRTGVFMVSEDDEGISPMFTEPYWSRDIGISVYRDSGSKTGAWALGLGFIFAGLWVALTLFMKRHLKKEKLY